MDACIGMANLFIMGAKSQFLKSDPQPLTRSLDGLEATR